jgi:hypothetical protein
MGLPLILTSKFLILSVFATVVEWEGGLRVVSCKGMWGLLVCLLRSGLVLVGLCARANANVMW